MYYPPRNFGAIPEESAAFAPARVVVLPVPYDSTSTYRAGAREGPAAIIDASQYLELFDHELGRETYRVGICTQRELEPAMGGPAEMLDRVEQAVAELLAGGKLVAMLGGEHSITVGAVRAHRHRHPGLSVLQLDAHADLHDSYLGTPYNHACVGRRLLEICPLVSVGLRAFSKDEWHFAQEIGLPFVGAERVRRSGSDRAAWMGDVIGHLSESVYVTLDLDALDPSLMAAVGTPEPGGLEWYAVCDLLAEVARHRRIVGFDVVELAPALGPPACSFTAAKLVYRLIGLATAGTAD